MLIVAGHLQVDPSQRDAYLEAAAAVTRLARAQPGCLAFVQAADPLEPDRIAVYERWADEASLLAFRTSDPDAPPLPELQGADVRRFDVAREGPP